MKRFIKPQAKKNTQHMGLFTKLVEFRTKGTSVCTHTVAFLRDRPHAAELTRSRYTTR